MDTASLALNPLLNLWYGFLFYLPQILTAIIVIIIGWIIASIVGGIVKRLVRFTGVDAHIEKSGLNQRLSLQGKNAKYRMLSSFIGQVVKWILIIATLGLAADIVGLSGVNAFVGAILAYIPNVIVAAIILTVGFLAAEFVSDLLLTGLDASQLPFANRPMIASIVRYAIIVFAVMAALTQLQIVPRLIEIAFAGIVFALSLAFGLGGKEHASDWIRKMRNQA